MVTTPITLPHIVSNVSKIGNSYVVKLSQKDRDILKIANGDIVYVMSGKNA